MTATEPGHIHVRSADGVVEVEGLTQSEVEFALELASGVQDEQLRARAALSATVQRAMLSRDVPLVSRASQRQIQRDAEVRRRLLEDEGAETYSSLATLRGTSESSARTWVARARKAQELFTVEVNGRTFIPAVLLTPEGKIDAEVAELCRPLIAAGLGGWQLWSWLTSPNGLLSGEVPARLAHTDMHRAHRAAVRFAAMLPAPESAGQDHPARTPSDVRLDPAASPDDHLHR